MSTAEQPSEKRTRLKLDDELKIQLAMDRYGPQRIELEVLAKRYNRAESVVSRAIASAFSEGLVEVRRAGRRSAPVRRSDLEEALLNRFPVLRGAIVVETGKLEDHQAQEKLGNALAWYLHDRVWSDKERVVIGGGRCAHHTADSLAKFAPRLRSSGVTVVSACGDCYPNHRESNLWLDADANASLLASSFEELVEVTRTSKHIIIREDEQEQRWKTDYGDRNIASGELPTLGIFGVGAFDRYHRLARLAWDDTAQQLLPPRDLVSHPISLLKDLLVESEVIAQRRKSEGPVVAEIGMSLFCVDNDAPDVLRSKVENINRCLFAPTMEQLSRVGSIILVGGGEAKVPALRGLLERPASAAGARRPPFHMLCTNEHTSRLLLR